MKEWSAIKGIFTRLTFDEGSDSFEPMWQPHPFMPAVPRHAREEAIEPRRKPA